MHLTLIDQHTQAKDRKLPFSSHYLTDNWNIFQCEFKMWQTEQGRGVQNHCGGNF